MTIRSHHSPHKSSRSVQALRIYKLCTIESRWDQNKLLGWQRHVLHNRYTGVFRLFRHMPHQTNYQMQLSLNNPHVCTIIDDVPAPFTFRASLLILSAFINSNKVSSPPSLLLKMRQKTLRIPNGLIGVEGVDTTRIRRTRGRGSTCYVALLSTCEPWPLTSLLRRGHSVIGRDAFP